MSDTASRSGTSHRPEELEQHRVELTGYCYRMLGSAFEAEDAVQETLVRAWRGLHRFEGRAALRSWLYHIATNVCFDLLKGRQRRARPIDLGPAWSAGSPLGSPLAETTWVEPVPDSSVLAAGADPAEQAISRESVRLAFVAALQHLPPRQRAVLILREVLRWRAAEVAELLGTSSASVNSALQRARSTLGERGVSDSDPVQPMDDTQRALVTRYVDAFERYDLDSLVSLLHEDATQSMPPYDLWMRGPEQMRAWWSGPGIECRGSRLVATAANSCPAFGQYRPSGPGGAFEPFSLHVLELTGDRITDITYFLDTDRLFPLFGLPPSL
ncbi:MAG TPA: sigma-70 family RNA polymerase sigma factor [Actinoallomurus sp.]|jgi:RNA polymerase sigma-70 factor (ECF subfamily)|nr:sigma-70 family RNA polymerase sigma factor [Actinoallomurus sp.]